MRIYITTAQIPELAGLPSQARRALRHSAFQQMFARQPRLRWLPLALCVLGALIGILTFGALPSVLFAWANGSPLIPNAYILVVATLGGVGGDQYLTHRARRYLREIISRNADNKQSAA